MADEKTQFWITGALIAAVTGLYGFFITHIVGHVAKRDVNGQIQQLWDKKQSTDRCNEIVRRIDEKADERHRATNEKLDRVLQYLENGGPHGRVRT